MESWPGAQDTNPQASRFAAFFSLSGYWIGCRMLPGALFPSIPSVIGLLGKKRLHAPLLHQANEGNEALCRASVNRSMTEGRGNGGARAAGRCQTGGENAVKAGERRFRPQRRRWRLWV